MEEHLRTIGGLKPVRRRHDAPRQAVRLFRPAVGHDLERHGDGRPPGPQTPRDRGHVQVGRHLRRRVRGLHALLLLDVRRRGRNAGEKARHAAGHHSRRRPEPHRPGHRVRLLLLPRQLRAARVGHRVDHGQQQPRDGLDRLRHLGPVVFRAPDDRGRAEHLRPRRARRRDRAIRRADAAEPVAGPEQRRRADHRHERRHDRGRRGPGKVQEHPAPPGTEAAGQRDCAEHVAGPQRKWPRWDSRRWSGRVSCSAAGRWKSATT